jgi:hypothetical protein
VKITITRRWSAEVVFEAEVDTEDRRIGMGLAIKLALSQKINLSGSNLRGSNLRGSDLSGSDLRGSNLQPIKDDIWAMLCYAPREVPALIEALKGGRLIRKPLKGFNREEMGDDRGHSVVSLVPVQNTTEQSASNSANQSAICGHADAWTCTQSRAGGEYRRSMVAPARNGIGVRSLA